MKFREIPVMLRERRPLVATIGAAVVSVISSVSAFATGETPPADGLQYVAITQDMLKPVIDGTTANLAVIIPVGIGLFAILLGVTLVPKVIKKFLS